MLLFVLKKFMASSLSSLEIIRKKLQNHIAKTKREICVMNFKTFC